MIVHMIYVRRSDPRRLLANRPQNIYYFVYVFVLWLKFPADDMKLLTAIVVAIFLAVPYLKEMRKSSFHALAKRNSRANGSAGEGKEN